jgi:hypothetical protein
LSNIYFVIFQTAKPTEVFRILRLEDDMHLRKCVCVRACVCIRRKNPTIGTDPFECPGRCLKCCKMSNIVFIAKVRSFFEQTSYIYHRALKRKEVLHDAVVSLIKCKIMGSGKQVGCKVDSSVQSCYR